MDGLILTPLKQIVHEKGDIFHAMKKSDVGFDAFGEAYFSGINKKDIKGWKKHKKMILNLIVPLGEIKFVFYDDRACSETQNDFFSVHLSTEHYSRITVPPDIWTAFQGVGESNLLLNIASIEHDPEESENIALDQIEYEW